jgi:hypothetical protein
VTTGLPLRFMTTGVPRRSAQGSIWGGEADELPDDLATATGVHIAPR